METAEIVGGLNVGELIEGGAEFEIKQDVPVDDGDTEEQECALALQNYLKLECLDFGNCYDGSEPFVNLCKGMVDLIPDCKVKKKILREGYGGTPENSKNVLVNYNAYVQFQAEPFDSTYVRKKPFSFTLGAGEVIEGLEIAVKSMKINEKAQFLINPELAYRSGGLGRIPPDSVVLFEVELCEIKEAVKEQIPEGEERKFERVYPQCLALCVKGKNLFRVKNYRGSIKEYNIAVNKLEDAILNDYDDQVKSEELLVRLYTNLLICCTHAEIPKRGCIFAQKIYEMSKNKTFKVSAKVYFNHAKCQRMLGSFDNAERKLRQARALEFNNLEILKEMNVLKKVRAEYKRHEMNLGRALFR